ncbi:unnamed protein product [Cuscuta europaea]|uniref:Uncharacterized protein n=1 Tax=Cuscuta europaea TaxID=41803 RepID=A0A9P1E304_CUSEU|nr:unnamed protein product [Cuscuta europaea]
MFFFFSSSTRATFFFHRSLLPSCFLFSFFSILPSLLPSQTTLPFLFLLLLPIVLHYFPSFSELCDIFVFVFYYISASSKCRSRPVMDSLKRVNGVGDGSFGLLIFDASLLQTGWVYSFCPGNSSKRHLLNGMW